VVAGSIKFQHQLRVMLPDQSLHAGDDTGLRTLCIDFHQIDASEFSGQRIQRGDGDHKRIASGIAIMVDKLSVFRLAVRYEQAAFGQPRRAQRSLLHSDVTGEAIQQTPTRAEGWLHAD